MMRIVLVAISLTAVSVSALAAENSGPRLGVGILLGEPTGFSAELELNQTHSLDGAISYSLVQGALHLHSDYLIRLNTHRHSHRFGVVVPYFGLGAQLALGEEKKDGLSVRLPVGVINFSLKRRLGVFLEFVPGMSILPETDFVMGAALGARYYF